MAKVPTDKEPLPALDTYRARRRFDRTPEPAGGGQASPSGLAFVIQKHWATRLHYDFRLELDGVMKSWAVPKGPSLDPADKRMAVATEDHPIAYNTFEGEIPKGNYGAGKVIIWDKGTWHPAGDARQGLHEGKLKFELRGHKLQGHWTLVRMKGRGQGREDPWLLIKERDDVARAASSYSITDALPDSVSALPPPRPLPEPAPSGRAARARTAGTPADGPPADGPPAGARPAPLPATLSPQLAVLTEHPPEDTALGWIYEIKFDGYRLLTRAESGTPRLFTRNGNDWTDRMPQLRDALTAMDLPDGWYDGEIILPGSHSPADFQALQGAFDTRRTADIVYYLFDLPFCAGQDLRHSALEDRRAVLRRIVERKPQPRVRFSDVFDAPPRQVVAKACELGLEGVMAKRLGSRYLGRRSGDWLKLKCGLRQEFVVGGYTEPQGSRTGLGALLLGVHAPDGSLRYAGSVGTGFSQEALADLRRRLDTLAAARSPFAAGTRIAGRPRWVQPELVAEVAFSEWTREQRVRHAVFHGLREDKPPASITREPVAPATPGGRRRPASASAAAAPAAMPSMRLTHPERVVDTSTGVTKLDMARHYAQVAELMLPHLAERPVALVRAPGGIDGELFFQKHSERYAMEGITALDPGLDPGHKPLLAVASAEGLLSAAQMNVIEFHTWNATAAAIDRPDRMTFDLDPGEGVGWAEMQQAAQLVRSMLDELGLPAFLKTSGGKGLHLVVPLRPHHGWDAVKGFSQAVVQHLARALPDRFVAKSGPRNRVGRIFIDYLRNGYGATTVAAWSARARPGLGVSVPIGWDELDGLPSSTAWTVKNVHERVPLGNAPWRDYEQRRTALDAAMKALP